MYIIELVLKFTPFPLSVQRMELASAQSLYSQIIKAIQQGHPKLLELTCEKVDGKKIAVLVDEIIGIQIYEKTSSSSGNKKPGFSFEN